MKLKLIVAAVLLSVPRVSFAQQADEARQRNECRLATQIITTGQPAPRMSWAESKIGSCGAEAGAAVAEGIRVNRTSRDTVTLSRLGNVAVVLRDGKMFGAALDVVADDGASPEARVFASRVLVLGLQPHLYMTYEQISLGRCYGQIRGSHATRTRGGAPVSAELIARAREIGRRVHRDSTASLPVRRSARCVALHDAAPFREPVDDPGYVIISKDLTLTYVCGNQFRVHNPLEYERTVRYEVERTRSGGTVTLPPESDRIVTADRAGTMRLEEVDGERITETRNEGRPCAP